MRHFAVLAFVLGTFLPAGPVQAHLQAENNTDVWWVRCEYATVSKGSTSVDGAEITGDEASAEVAYRLTTAWQLAARFDWRDNRLGAPLDDGPFFANLNDHQDLGIAVNYWFSPNLVTKTEYHWIEGNRFAFPDWENFIEISQGIEKQTGLFQVGAQFSF